MKVSLPIIMMLLWVGQSLLSRKVVTLVIHKVPSLCYCVLRHCNKVPGITNSGEERACLAGGLRGCSLWFHSHFILDSSREL